MTLGTCVGAAPLCPTPQALATRLVKEGPASLALTAHLDLHLKSDARQEASGSFILVAQVEYVVSAGLGPFGLPVYHLLAFFVLLKFADCMYTSVHVMIRMYV